METKQASPEAPNPVGHSRQAAKGGKVDAPIRPVSGRALRQALASAQEQVARECDLEASVRDAAYPVQGTSLKGDGEYSDIAVTNLFGAYVSTINGERQVIWQRYNVMLLVNTFLLSELLRAPWGPPALVWRVVGAATGLAVCLFWYLMLKDGLTLFSIWNACAARFRWVGPPTNPYLLSERWRGGSCGRWIHWGALGTILVFAAAYLVILHLAVSPRWPKG